MTTNWHTPFTSGTNQLTTVNLNTRLSELDSGISELDDTAAAVYYYPSLGENVSAGQAGYIGITDGIGYLLHPNDSPPAAGLIRGIWKTSALMGATGKLQLTGILDGFSGLTPRLPIFVGATAGSLTQTRPAPVLAGSQVVIMQLGIALSATTIWINPKPVEYQKRVALASGGAVTVLHHEDFDGYWRRVSAFDNTPGYRSTQVAVDWWFATYADMVNQYGGAISYQESVTFKCTRASGFSDITVVVMVP